MMNPLSIGEHKVKLKIVRDYDEYMKKFGKTMVEKGEFTIVKSANSKKVKLKTFADVISGMKDPKLEAKAIATINEMVKKDYSGVYTLQKQECKILSKDWMIYNHPSSGAILARAINAAFLLKGTDGECRVAVFRLKQTYTGSGFQETLLSVPLDYVTDYEAKLRDDSKCECE